MVCYAYRWLTLWLNHTIDERIAMLQRAEEKFRINQVAIEKDWWVTVVLNALFKCSCADQLIFKGGTSLSKGWYCLDVWQTHMAEQIRIVQNALPTFKEAVEQSLYPMELTFRFERLVYRVLASEVISYSKAAALLDKSVNEVRDTLNLM